MIANGNGYSINEAKQVWAICLEVATKTFDATEPRPSYADKVARLMFMTAAHESQNFLYRRQRGFGEESTRGAWSLWQVEWASILDSLDYLGRRDRMLARVVSYLSPEAAALLQEGVENHALLFAVYKRPSTLPRSDIEIAEALQRRILKYLATESGDKLGAVFCRVHYLRDIRMVPDGDTAMAEYAKTVYNTERGAAKALDYLAAYRRWISLATTVSCLVLMLAGCITSERRTLDTERWSVEREERVELDTEAINEGVRSAGELVESLRDTSHAIENELERLRREYRKH